MRQKHLPFAALVITLAALTAFGPVATDMYLPGMSEMASHFGSSAGYIQSTISLFVLGLAFGQLIYGPLSDRFGRRMPLLAGVAIFTVASLGCALATGVQWLIVLRFAQAVGAAAGMLIVRAIVNDLFERTEVARVLSLMMMVMMVAPIVAPLLGGWMLLAWGWQSIFWFMVCYGLVCAALVLFVVPESLPAHRRQPLSFGGMFATYRQLIVRRGFIVPALCCGLASGTLFAYITGSEFVFTQLYGLSVRQYSTLFACNAGALVLSNFMNRRLLLRWRVDQVFSTALLLQAGCASLLVVAVALELPMAFFIVALWLVVGCMGLIGANGAAIAMGAAGQHGGSASGLLGVTQFGIASMVSAAVAATQNGTAYPLALTIGACAITARTLWWLGRPAAR